MGPARYARLVLALLAAGSIVGAAGPAAATALHGPNRPDWSGLWFRVGSSSDPAAKVVEGPQPVPTDERLWPPLTSPYRDKYRLITGALAEGRRLNDPTGNCLPAGFPRMMMLVYPMEIHQTPSQITLITEAMSQTRRIYIGDPSHPQDLDPTYFGHSIAKWEGRALVIDTVGLRADTTLNDTGLPHGDRTHVVERWTQRRPDTLDDELTVIDPQALTAPWTRILHYRRAAPGVRILEYVCENNRDASDLAAGRRQFEPAGGR